MRAALLRSWPAQHYRNDTLRYNASDVVNDSPAPVIYMLIARSPTMGEGRATCRYSAERGKMRVVLENRHCKNPFPSSIKHRRLYSVVVFSKTQCYVHIEIRVQEENCSFLQSKYF